MKIKKSDIVKILSGKDRGKTGKVIRVDLKNGKILVEGINIKKKHVRAKRQDKKGEIILVPAPLHVSMAMPVCPRCKKSVRVRLVVKESGKTRTCRKCGNEF